MGAGGGSCAGSRTSRSLPARAQCWAASCTNDLFGLCRAWFEGLRLGLFYLKTYFAGDVVQTRKGTCHCCPFISGFCHVSCVVHCPSIVGLCCVCVILVFSFLLALPSQFYPPVPGTVKVCSGAPLPRRVPIRSPSWWFILGGRLQA